MTRPRKPVRELPISLRLGPLQCSIVEVDVICGLACDDKVPEWADRMAAHFHATGELLVEEPLALWAELVDAANANERDRRYYRAASQLACRVIELTAERKDPPR